MYPARPRWANLCRAYGAQRRICTPGKRCRRDRSLSCSCPRAAGLLALRYIVLVVGQGRDERGGAGLLDAWGLISVPVVLDGRERLQEQLAEVAEPGHAARGDAPVGGEDEQIRHGVIDGGAGAHVGERAENLAGERPSDGAFQGAEFLLGMVPAEFGVVFADEHAAATAVGGGVGASC